MIYTVLIHHKDSREIAAHHVEATDGQDALYKVAKEHGGELIVAIAGECHEAFSEADESKIGTMTYAGSGLVDAQEYIELMDEEDPEKISDKYRTALLAVAGVSSNENSEPDRMADALGEIQGIVRRALDSSKGVHSAPNLAEHVRILREALFDNLQAWEGEEESVKEEHADLIEETHAALESTKERP